MKIVMGIGGALLTLVAAIVLWPSTPAIGPEPIAYGKDGCARCHMIISQPGFGGEIRGDDGAISKYDDLGCMLVALWRKHRAVHDAWVEDQAGGGFVSLTAAVFVRDSALATPMGYGVLAFADAGVAARFAKDRGGEVVALGDLLHDSARFQKGHAEHTRR